MLAQVVLLGAVTLLVFLIAIPFVVPHQSLPEAIIVFASIFTMIAALIAGTAGTYLFMSRAPPVLVGEPPPLAPSPQRSSVSSTELVHVVLRLLEGDERAVIEVLIASQGTIIQRDLVKSTAFSDAKVSRLLDKLEARGLVVREREGMSNRIRLTLRS